ncbi:hypothetical protein QYF36_007703 [Acer negundo]|nr:hypothetical protein QYF36_007703 [Acer negundo]
MDSSTRLDYALFQLTPTRTRFDLVLFCRGNNEKLASGLFDPFISHLKFARDEISKGGYSINLRPPTQAANWFTKATFERFVRFVSTPAVLERFVSIEKEILQIEGSIQANELSTQIEQGSVSFADGNNTRKSTDESVQEENSKIQLQRLLETRRTLLRKEQAMAFARGVVAGFEKENIDDLISFADAYGAARLREACINFKELCKKKRGDGLWMEELAAISPSELTFMGTSGIVLANETSAPNQNVLLNFTKFDVPLDGSKSDSTTSSDSKKDDNLPASGQVPSNVPVPWPNQLPPYMYGFQGPIQHMPPYQGYPFPPMQPHYAANMQWRPDMEETYHRKKSSFGKKEKYLNRKDPEHSGEDTQTESSDSDSENNSESNVQEEKRNSSTELSHGKKHRKKSSRTVVIRNINYITPNRRNGENGGGSDESSSGEDEFIDGDSIKKKVDDAVGLLRKTHKSNLKQKSSNKSLNVANGSNGATDPDFDDDSVAEAAKKGKGNENWDAFQNLLMIDEGATVNGVERLHAMDVQDDQITVRISEGGISSSTRPAVDLESEKVPKQPVIATDSFVLTGREGGSEGRAKLEDFENGENFRSVLKRADCTDEELLFSRGSEAGSQNGGIQSTFATESSITKTAKGEDWFVANNSAKLDNQNATNGQTIFDGDHILPVGDQFHSEKHKKDLIDDSFMVQGRSATDDLYDSQWRTDISMVAGLTSAASPGNGSANVSQEKQEGYEPDDLYMVLERESEFQSTKDSWTVDFGIDESLVEANSRRSSVAVDVKLPSNDEVNGSKDQRKEARSKVSRGSIGKGKPELISKNRKPSLLTRPTAVQKSKFEKEEEMRNKIEELKIQRQKRIAERTAASGVASTASRKGPAKGCNAAEEMTSLLLVAERLYGGG